MEQAIKKAIEGGWSVQQSYYTRQVAFTKLKSVNEYHTVVELDFTTQVEDEIGRLKDVPVTETYQTPKIFLDPLFWQCLGKALGWSDLPFWRYGETCKKCGENLGGIRYVQWQYIWHSFIDHLAEGGNIDGFFKNLLK